MSSQSKEQFTIRPLLPSQAREAVEIEASTSIESALARLVFPDAGRDLETGENAEETNRRHQRHVKEMVESLGKPECLYRVVTCAQADDSELLKDGAQLENNGNELAMKDEKIVAFAHWEFHKGRSEDEWREFYDTRKERRPEGIHHDLVDATGGQRTLKKAKILGSSDYYCLEGLYVYPAYQRRGIGGMLVADGVQRADEMGWLSYMDATSKGDGLYRKHGFEEQDRVVVDLSDWGGKKGEMSIYTLLARPAKKV